MVRYNQSVFTLALKNLWQERVKFILSIGGVSFAIVLMVVLLGVYEGFKGQFVINITKNPAHAFVVQEGIRDFFHGVSIIPEETGNKIKNIDGILEAIPMVGVRAIIDLNDKKWDLLLFSFVNDSTLGAPWNVVEGTDQLSENEMVVDQRFMNNNNLTLGDKLNANGQEFTIAGIAKDASSILTSFAFIRLEDAQRLSKLGNAAGFYSIRVTDATKLDDIIATIENETEGLNAFSKQEFIDNNMAEIEEGYLPIVSAMVVIAFIVGVAIIALTVYTATIDKSREYGILKAIGIKDVQLYKVVFFQSLISSILGFIIGVSLSYVTSYILYTNMGLHSVITGQTLVYVFAVVLVMSVIATFVPIRRITQIDPAEVFKS